ncbi:MAG: hypothetical protein ACRDD8_05320 [Bacteroidales bacterium]
MDAHTKMFEELMKKNNETLYFVEKVPTSDVEPYIYKVLCLPSTFNKAISSSQNLTTSRNITLRFLKKDIVGLKSVSGDREFCDLDDIQSCMSKAIYKNRRYVIDEISLNGFGNLVIITLSSSEE